MMYDDPALNAAWEEGYEAGYRNGESSLFADVQIALDDAPFSVESLSDIAEGVAALVKALRPFADVGGRLSDDLPDIASIDAFFAADLTVGHLRHAHKVLTI